MRRQTATHTHTETHKHTVTSASVAAEEQYPTPEHCVHIAAVSYGLDVEARMAANVVVAVGFVAAREVGLAVAVHRSTNCQKNQEEQQQQ